MAWNGSRSRKSSSEPEPRFLYRNSVSWVAVASQRRSGDGLATETPRESDSSPTRVGTLTPLVESGLSKR